MLPQKTLGCIIFKNYNYCPLFLNTYCASAVKGKAMKRSGKHATVFCDYGLQASNSQSEFINMNT